MKLNDINQVIYKLPLSSEKKMLLNKNIRWLAWRLRYREQDFYEVIKNLTICFSNYYYGHEYWIKNYSGYKDYIYGLIEHGIYFGEDKSKAGLKEEWDLGSVFTFGDNRIHLLNSIYPDFYIEGIGPRVHYAPTDVSYYNELKSKLVPESRTIALYPSHSLYERKSLYKANLFMNKALEVADEIKAENILLSLHPADIANGLDKELVADKKNIIIVSGGGNMIYFLPRLRAIMMLADFIYTNDIGTHVGYGIYFKKQNYIDLSTNTNNYYSEAFLKDQKLFADTFNFISSDPFTITSEQKDLCNYYFGYSHIKTPEEMYKCLENCKKEYDKRFK